MSDEIEALARRLTSLLERTSAESRFHLETALRAAETDNVGGTVLVQVPRRVAEHVTVKWAGGSAQLALPI